jgi:O-antigen/teichoic acid export membrane protein
MVASPVAALGSKRAVVSAGAVVAVAGVVVNGLAAIVPVVAARPLPVDQFGALSALLAVGTVVAVVGVALQTTLAVRWARHERVDGADRLSLATTAVATGALLAAVPLLSILLHLAAVQTLLLAALTCPVVLAGRWLGELQGRQRYARLAAGMVLLALGRYGGMLVALIAGLGVTASLAVGAATAWVAIVPIALLTVRHGPAVAAEQTGARVTGREVVRAGAATIAMLAISYADLILARALLPADEAGAYAVGSVLTKATLWAPAVVTVLALPMFAQARRNAVRITLGATAGVGAVVVVATALAGTVAMRVAGGARYAHLGKYAFAFAAVGALYALVFVVVNAEIAKHVRRPAMWLWVCLAAITTAATLIRPSTVGGLLAISVTTATVTLTVTTTAYALWRRYQRPADTAVTAEPATI